MHTNVWIILVATIFVLLFFFRSRADSPRPTSIEPWVIDAFRKRRRQQWLMSVPVAALFIFLRWGHAHPSTGVGMQDFLLLGLVAVAGLFTYRNWRCPKCDAYVGKYPMYSGVCPKCGTALRLPTR